MASVVNVLKGSLGMEVLGTNLLADISFCLERLHL